MDHLTHSSLCLHHSCCPMCWPLDSPTISFLSVAAIAASVSVCRIQSRRSHSLYIVTSCSWADPLAPNIPYSNWVVAWSPWSHCCSLRSCSSRYCSDCFRKDRPKGTAPSPAYPWSYPCSCWCTLHHHYCLSYLQNTICCLIVMIMDIYILTYTYQPFSRLTII